MATWAPVCRITALMRSPAPVSLPLHPSEHLLDLPLLGSPCLPVPPDQVLNFTALATAIPDRQSDASLTLIQQLALPLGCLSPPLEEGTVSGELTLLD